MFLALFPEFLWIILLIPIILIAALFINRICRRYKQEREFVINKYLKIRLGGKETFIYVAGKPFEICKYLLFNIPIIDIENVNSIGEAVDKYGKRSEKTFYNMKYRLSAEEEFVGHCSNLQIWAERGYDSRLLRVNLAFPLLRWLTEVGDVQAKAVFKEEIKERFESMYSPVQEYLLIEGYLDYFTFAEQEELHKYITDVDIWLHIGRYMMLLYDIDQTLKAYSRALHIDPINKTALI